MKNLVFLLLFVLPSLVPGQTIQYNASTPHTDGTPSGAPTTYGAWIRYDKTNKVLYRWTGAAWTAVTGAGVGGIYGGSGTVPAGTTATMDGNFSFANASAAAGERFSVTVDDGSSTNYFELEAGQGILLQSSGDGIFLEGETGFTDVLASGALGASQNNYAGLDGANVGLLSASTAIDITGIANGFAGRVLFLFNTSANTITLKNNSGSSIEANQFDIGNDYELTGDKGVILIYDGTATNWRLASCPDDLAIPDQQIAYGNTSGSGLSSDAGFLFDGDGIQITEAGAYVGLYGSSSAQFFAIDESASAATKGGQLLLASHDGAAMASGDRLGAINFGGQTGVGGTGVGATIEAYTAGTWGGGDAPGELRIYTTPDGSATPAERMKVTMSGDVGIKKNSDGATQDFTTVTAYGAETNLGVAIRPKGSGAFSLDMPDGASTGGNSRGTNAVDLQITRSAAYKVASGNYSFLGGGRNNTASGDGSFCVGGSSGFNVGSVASGTNSGTFGNADTASAVSAFVMGQTSTASGNYSQAFGLQALANHMGQAAFGSADAGAVGYAQSSTMRVYTAKMGTGAIELYLNGTGGGARMTLVDNQFWNVTIQVLATTQTVGNGAGTAGHTYAATYSAVVKRIGGTTALVGTVQTISAAQSDASMSDAVFTIDADNTNDALRVQFTPPSTAGSSSVYKAFATMYLAELRY